MQGETKLMVIIYGYTLGDEDEKERSDSASCFRFTPGLVEFHLLKASPTLLIDVAKSVEHLLVSSCS